MQDCNITYTSIFTVAGISQINYLPNITRTQEEATEMPLPGIYQRRRKMSSNTTTVPRICKIADLELRISRCDDIIILILIGPTLKSVDLS